MIILLGIGSWLLYFSFVCGTFTVCQGSFALPPVGRCSVIVALSRYLLYYFFNLDFQLFYLHLRFESIQWRKDCSKKNSSLTGGNYCSALSHMNVFYSIYNGFFAKNLLFGKSSTCLYLYVSYKYLMHYDFHVYTNCAYCMRNCYSCQLVRVCVKVRS